MGSYNLSKRPWLESSLSQSPDNGQCDCPHADPQARNLSDRVMILPHALDDRRLLLQLTRPKWPPVINPLCKASSIIRRCATSRRIRRPVHASTCLDAHRWRNVR